MYTAWCNANYLSQSNQELSTKWKRIINNKVRFKQHTNW